MKLAVEFLALVAVLICCLYASYTDIRFRRIGNRCTFSLVFIGLLCQILFLFLEVTTPLRIGVLFFSGLVIGLLMYLWGLWSPGDAKLYWGVSLAVPPTLYIASVQSPLTFSPIALLINSFVPYFFILLGIALVRTSGAQKLQAVKDALSIKFLLETIFSILCFVGLMLAVAFLLPFRLPYFYRLVVMISLFWVTRKIVAPGYQKVVLAPFLLLGVYFGIGDPLGFVKMLLLVLFVYILPRVTALGLGARAFSEEVGIEELRKGMIPGEIVLQANNERGEVRYWKVASGKQGQEKGIPLYESGGLKEEKVRELKQLAQEGRFESFGSRLLIQQSMPFAPVILMGVVLTVLFGGSFLSPLVQWARRFF